MRNPRPVKDKIMALLSVKHQLNSEIKNHEEFGDIINYFMSKDFLENNIYRIPSLKTIHEDIGISYNKVRSRIIKLYDYLFDYEKGFSFEYNEIEVLCTARSCNESVMFRLNGLKHIPKIGEEMDLFFLRGKFYTSYFYVEKVTHEFEDNKQIINISLAEGFFNPYWYIRKSEAIAKGEISIDERFELAEYQLKKKFNLE